MLFCPETIMILVQLFQLNNFVQITAKDKRK